VAKNLKSIKYYEEALKVCAIERYPIGYAVIQNNIRSAYSGFLT